MPPPAPFAPLRSSPPRGQSSDAGGMAGPRRRSRRPENRVQRLFQVFHRPQIPRQSGPDDSRPVPIRKTSQPRHANGVPPVRVTGRPESGFDFGDARRCNRPRKFKVRWIWPGRVQRIARAGMSLFHARDGRLQEADDVSRRKQGGEQAFCFGFSHKRRELFGFVKYHFALGAGRLPGRGEFGRAAVSEGERIQGFQGAGRGGPSRKRPR